MSKSSPPPPLVVAWPTMACDTATGLSKCQMPLAAKNGTRRGSGHPVCLPGGLARSLQNFGLLHVREMFISVTSDAAQEANADNKSQGLLWIGTFSAFELVVSWSAGYPIKAEMIEFHVFSRH